MKQVPKKNQIWPFDSIKGHLVLLSQHHYNFHHPCSPESNGLSGRTERYSGAWRWFYRTEEETDGRTTGLRKLDNIFFMETQCLIHDKDWKFRFIFVQRRKKKSCFKFLTKQFKTNKKIKNVKKSSEYILCKMFKK